MVGSIEATRAKLAVIYAAMDVIKALGTKDVLVFDDPDDFELYVALNSYAVTTSKKISKAEEAEDDA